MTLTTVVPSSPGAEITDDLRPLRVLIVEDDAFTLAILQKRLAGAGYRVATAVNGREGLAQVEQFKPDIILSDWMMPEMDGLELLARVRAMPEHQGVYFMLLTAKDRDEDKISGLDTGADEYLIKPCEGRELMARVRAAGRIVRLQQRLNQRNEQLEHALRRLNEELEATSQVQRAFLPEGLPAIDGWEFAAHYRPSSECSGDFYHCLTLPDGRLLLAIGDVSGHGAPAMVAMALVQTLLKLQVPQASAPDRTLAALNRLMFEHLPTSHYVTMFLGFLDCATGRMDYSSAGHPPPLWVHDGESVFLSGCAGFPIKLVQRDASYDLHRIQLEPGQRLLLYTDGLIEAFNGEGEMYGSQRLAECTRHGGGPAAPWLEHVLEDLQRHTGPAPLEDDLSLLAVVRL